MVIGNGMIAKRFEDYSTNNDYIIFASGVSDSTTTAPEAFSREENLLTKSIQANPEKTLVYFSTCSIYDPSMRQSAYVLHKLKMEAVITANAKNYLIFRVSNPIGRTSNTHTVFNFFIQHIQEKTPFAIWKNASRNLLDIDDMYAICDHLLKKKLFTNSVVNIANPVNYPVTTIIAAIENHFHTKGIYTFAEKGSSPLIDTTAIEPFFNELNITFNELYLPGLLRKYFI
ncbi:NAD-dependent epimerase/dehydratase family protein [Niastella caeni]|uniref:NAD-dependent epimerase/dehydratase family protein n=1 Tax=Niastella caeni TaxID=2569763 RepID=A0A4S8I1A5_9BACT|nr:NAD-dependent epimerase/dehydratase family protein [Niastella caeni]THU39462.1 NAD-dependent epimerase/dehydratase family protein [Niastella caeni]